jgi:tetratricopeptide (TPR) repeat protein
MFMEKRVYQGSSGVVYPYPVIEKIMDEKTDKTYIGLFLENRYLKIMILPQLGGRVQMAWDKIRQRHFVYYNSVIKPALVGLTGPWISGGIEFNWPQHHRPSTFEPVDFSLEENPDGSSTIWINEVERMFHTKATVGFTLYPEKAYLEISARLYNTTPFPQTFLWWANPAVKVNDHYQSIFPPDVHAVYDHGKRDVSEFPIAKGEYYKVNYAPGTDISRYKNIPVPTSFMAVSSKYDFIGGYEHDTRGGLLHVADHHVSPGKKQWTWGNGEFGKAWDRNLTDEDGPYIEIMTGVFTDNQPDFSWLQPYEEKAFKQYFMPYSEVGVVKNANIDAVVGMNFSPLECALKLYLTAPFSKLLIKLTRISTGAEIFSEEQACEPGSPVSRTIAIEKGISPQDLLLTVTDTYSGKVLISCTEEKPGEKPIPSPASPALSPAETTSTEELYLTGLHLEQYRHATYLASDYYEEALRRYPGDIRNNNALGLWLLRRGKPLLAENHFRTAIRTLTKRNPNPYDGEAYYNLGWSLMLQEKYDEAYDSFYKSIWNYAWKHAGSLNLARIASLRKDYSDALTHIETALVNHWNNHSGRIIKTFLLRKSGHTDEALAFADESIKIDHFNYGVQFEKYLILKEKNSSQAEKALLDLQTLMRDGVNNYLEYAFEYAHSGLYEEAMELLSIYTGSAEEVYPMAWYCMGWFSHKSGNDILALSFFRQAAACKPDYCFPNRVEEAEILKYAIGINQADSNAPYYLGNLYYDKRQYQDAIGYWELSRSINPAFPTVHRNLALACFNKENDPQRALNLLEKAFQLDESDARILMEFDQLRKKLNHQPDQRLKLLEKHIALVIQRDDLYLERITLLNQMGEFAKAKELLHSWKFHPWEGGEGKVVGQFLFCTLELAKEAIALHDYRKALVLLDEAGEYPENLGEGKLLTAQENDIHYLKGHVLEKLEMPEKAEEYYKLSTQGASEPVQAVFYNDPQPDKIFYQGLAWVKLKNPSRAVKIFDSLIQFGENHFKDIIKIDYFAVSLPDMQVFDTDLDQRNHIHCLYMQGLGYLGKSVNADLMKAKSLFNEVLKLDSNHQGALAHQKMTDIVSL